MPKRTDIQKILIIGSGPIIIGQACEFDYSGTQACKALKQLGYTIVLVNSNPATIMTDPETADITYIEPLDMASLTRIIDIERPDAVLPNLGGQSGLNLCLELHENGVLEKYGVNVIGINVEAIQKGEDRIIFKEAMKKLGIEMAKSSPAYTLDEALAIADTMGYPVVIRPAYTMGGAGGGLCYTPEELRAVASRGLAASLIGQVLVEESVLGWEELELEIVRDTADHVITVCFIENIDPMGVHTGDSFCAAPMITVPQKVQKTLEEYSHKIAREIQVVGGCNCQYAYDPATGRIVVIEINPRTSRSSALASKATGFPIALVSAYLAAGITLSELPYWKGGSLAEYIPSGDYVVVKFARWAFEKFKEAKDVLGTQMKAVGEVMSIGKTYKEALQKAIRSLETGHYGLGQNPVLMQKSKAELLAMLSTVSSERQFILYEAFKKGATVEELQDLTKIHPYFLTQMQELTVLEREIEQYKGQSLPDDLLQRAKLDGFADRYIAKIIGTKQEDIRACRQALGIRESWEAVPVSGAENASYLFSSYNPVIPNAAPPSQRQKIMILGGGPNRIGQGIEFDYCCVHAAFALRELGFETIIVNCNPETVSTDYDTSDKLYFEPLTVEDVLSIYEAEKPLGVIAQFGGQTPLNIARALEEAGVNILGTSPDTIDLAEDRDRFRAMMEELQIPMPQSAMAVTIDDAVKAAADIGYPLMVRPSYVLGGRGMEIVHDEVDLRQYMAAAVGVTPDRPILIDKFLENATEAEADAISDGESAFVPAVMEQIELAGIHSGDSACILPSLNISKANQDTINEYTARIAVKLGVRGLMNIQYAIHKDKVYVIEANPRASRTVPLVSKVCNIKMVHIATGIITAPYTKQTGLLQTLRHHPIPHYGVKEAVFPFNMFPEVDPLLGPEMRSTGEVLGIADSFGMAFYKSQQAAKVFLPLSGKVFISVNDQDKPEALAVAKHFHALGFTLVATQGTGRLLNDNGIPADIISKLKEPGTNVVDLIEIGEINFIINTPMGKQGNTDDSYIRKAAVKHRVAYITTIAAAAAAAEGISAMRQTDNLTPKSLQQYHREMA